MINVDNSVDPILATDIQLDAVESVMKNLIHEESDLVLSRMCHQHLLSGGKRLRTRLALETTKIFGGDEKAALYWAAACELLHNATLIHDDIQDQDRFRRGEKTIWYSWGEAEAINAGDFMLMLPYMAINKIPTDEKTKWYLSKAIAKYALQVVRGQSREFQLETRLDEPNLWDLYDEVCLGKTSALFELPICGAALLSGMTFEEAEKKSSTIGQLGLIFQMVDDVVDFMGQKKGRRSGEDLWEGKVSCLIVAYLCRFPNLSGKVKHFLQSVTKDQPQEEVEIYIKTFTELNLIGDILERVDHKLSELMESPELDDRLKGLFQKYLNDILRSVDLR